MTAGSLSAIIPTIGRPHALENLLRSLAAQSQRPDDVIVADASRGDEVRRVIEDEQWPAQGLRVRRIAVDEPNAVGQRRAAIGASDAEYLLMLDDDVVLERTCVQALVDAIHSAPDVVAVTADFNNQTWAGPTTLWRWYLRWLHGVTTGEWQGRVIGPLLRFGYSPSPAGLVPMEWLGAGNSLIRRTAYDQVGGFSEFFLHRTTINEDVDLGLKLRRAGRILLSPDARLAHMHAPEGRVSARLAAEDDLYNRFLILRHTQGLSAGRALGLVATFFLVETASNLGGCLRRFRCNGFGARLSGRLLALRRILAAPPSRSRH
ncbi:MAG: glycosyltransferase family 2 protein [Vicinamibacterales bacterium]